MPKQQPTSPLAGSRRLRPRARDPELRYWRAGSYVHYPNTGPNANKQMKTSTPRENKREAPA